MLTLHQTPSYALFLRDGNIAKSHLRCAHPESVTLKLSDHRQHLDFHLLSFVVL